MLTIVRVRGRRPFDCPIVPSSFWTHDRDEQLLYLIQQFQQPNSPPSRINWNEIANRFGIHPIECQNHFTQIQQQQQQQQFPPQPAYQFSQFPTASYPSHVEVQNLTSSFQSSSIPSSTVPPLHPTVAVPISVSNQSAMSSSILISSSTLSLHGNQSSTQLPLARIVNQHPQHQQQQHQQQKFDHQQHHQQQQHQQEEEDQHHDGLLNSDEESDDDFEDAETAADGVGGGGGDGNESENERENEINQQREMKQEMNSENVRNSSLLRRNESTDTISSGADSSLSESLSRSALADVMTQTMLNEESQMMLQSAQLQLQQRMNLYRNR